VTKNASIIAIIIIGIRCKSILDAGGSSKPGAGGVMNWLLASLTLKKK